MAAQSAVIFTGQVRSIEREDAHGYVDVSFTVQQALRGTRAGGAAGSAREIIR